MFALKVCALSGWQCDESYKASPCIIGLGTEAPFGHSCKYHSLVQLIKHWFSNQAMLPLKRLWVSMHKSWFSFFLKLICDPSWENRAYVHKWHPFTLCHVSHFLYKLPYSGKVWRGESLANWLFLSIWRKQVLPINRSVNRVSIVSTKLDGFSLVNHGWFANFAKLSCYTVYKFCKLH